MRKTRSLCSCILMIVFFAVSCKKSINNKIVIYNVEPELTLIGGRPPAPSLPKNIPAMVLVEKGTKDTLMLTLDRIEGFEYTEGFKYTIKVRIRNLENPPADGYIYSYQLLEEISKEKQES